MLVVFCAVLITGMIIVYLNKDKITKELISSAEKEFGLGVNCDDINISIIDHWPDISIQLQNLSVVNQNENPERKPLFKAEIVSLSVNVLKLLKREISVNEVSIRNGNISLEKNRLGNTNFEFKKKPAEKKENQTLNLNIKRINLRNIKLDFFNKQKNKHIGLVFINNYVELNWLNKDILATLKGGLKVNELLLKKEKGPFLKDKNVATNLGLIYSNKHKVIFIDKTSYINIEDQQYNLTGAVFLDTTKKLVLRIKADVTDFDKTLTLLSTKIQSNLATVRIKNLIKIDALIISKLGKDQPPLLKIRFSGTNNDVTLGQ